MNESATVPFPILARLVRVTCRITCLVRWPGQAATMEERDQPEAVTVGRRLWMKTLSRLPLYALAAILAGLPAYAAQQDHAGSVSLDQLMASLRTVGHVNARYIEHRYLHALRSPLETRGTLRFDAPDRLEKATDPSADGSFDRIAIKGNLVTIDRGAGAPPIILGLTEHPEIGVLVESIRATLSGEGEALRRIFDIALSGSLSEWQLILQPHDARQRDVLQWMRISGFGERITAIDTRDGDGDRTEMSIVELKP